jgi:hypothetical protein
MGGGASKKKQKVKEESNVKKPVWVTDLQLEDGTSYTGLTQMGLVKLKPHLVGQQTLIIDDDDDSQPDALDDAVSELGGDDDAEDADKDAKSHVSITRAPSDRSAKSHWSIVKSSASLTSVLKSNKNKHTSLASEKQGSVASDKKTNKTEQDGFSRLPSDKSAKSHWSDLKSRMSLASVTSTKVEEKPSTWVYLGEFLDGKRHGRGVRTYENGKVYVGEWEENEMHGWGVLTREDGSVYRGQFAKGVMHGRGAEIVVSSEQDNGYQTDDATKLFLSFEGRWVNGRREGRGLAGRARSSDAASVLGLVRVNVVKYSKGVLIPTESQPLAENAAKNKDLVKEQMDAWVQATLLEKKVDKLQTLVQNLLLDKSEELLG